MLSALSFFFSFSLCEYERSDALWSSSLKVRRHAGKAEEEPSHARTHTVPHCSDNRSNSVLHDEPVSYNSSQPLLTGIILTENKHVYLPENQQSASFYHTQETQQKIRATTTGLTLEKHATHHKQRHEMNTKNMAADTPVSECMEPLKIDFESWQTVFSLFYFRKQV